MRLPDLAVDRPVTTFMGLLCLVVLGVVAVTRLPLGFMPEVDRPRVVVDVPYPGSHPEEVLREIVEPLEDELALVEGVVGMESTAGAGSASIDLEFSPWDDMTVRRLEVREAVDRARPRLPDGVDRIDVRVGRHGPDTEATLQGRISADRDLSRDWDLIEQRIRARLERVPGVARVDLYGIEAPRLEVDLDLPALRRHRVPVESVARAIRAANADLALGAIHGSRLRFDVRGGGRPETAAEVAALPIPGTPFRVGDLARVSFAPPRLPYGRRLNLKPAIGFDVFKDPAANTVAVADRVRAAIGKINADPRLRGVRILVWRDQAEEIRHSLDGLFRSGLWGALLAAVVLFLFLRRFATTLLLATAIPFSVIVTCGVLFLLGMELDVLTLLGLMLGVGMLVDNAVVVVENVHRLQERGLPPREAARQGAGDVALAVTAATLTTVIVWSWLLFADPGPFRTYLGEVATTISLAVGCSLLVSLTFIPLAAARFLAPRPHRPGFFERRLVPAYRGILAWTLRHRVATLLLLAGLAASTLWPLRHVEMNGQPKMMPRRVPITYRIREPMNLDRLREVVSRVESAIWPHREELGISDIYSFYTEEGNWAITLLFVPRDLATEEHAAEIRRKVKPLLPEIPGVTLRTEERMFWRRRAGGRDQRRVVVALHGNEPSRVAAEARRLEPWLRDNLPGALDVMLPASGEQKEVRVLVDPDRVRAAGADPDRVAAAVAGFLRRRFIGRMRTPGGERQVFIGLPDRELPGLADLANVPILVRGGRTVPLSALVDWKVADTPEAIRRVGRRVTAWVMVAFPGKLTTAEARDRVAGVLARWPFPPDITWDWGRLGRERDDVLALMRRGTLLSLLVVVLLMAALFESLTQPLAIVITLPLAFFGAGWVLWLGGYDLDITGFMGVILLIGIVVNNGIVLVDHVNLLRRRGMPREEALVTGSGDRLRPVLMTAITTIAGLVPLALRGATVAGATIDSLAVVVIGGLASSTIFTLLALPVWTTLLEDAGTVLRRAVTPGHRTPVPGSPRAPGEEGA